MLEAHRDQHAEIVLVVDDENARLFFAHAECSGATAIGPPSGIHTSTPQRRPARTLSRKPPWAPAPSPASASPRPTPSVLADPVTSWETHGSKIDRSSSRGTPGPSSFTARRAQRP